MLIVLIVKDFVRFPQMLHQPYTFEAVTHGYLYQQTRKKEKCLVHRIINVESLWPENYSLGYFKPTVVCSTIWYNQPQIGRYKSHFFYQPTAQIHENVYTIF